MTNYQQAVHFVVRYSFCEMQGDHTLGILVYTLVSPSSLVSMRNTSEVGWLFCESKTSPSKSFKSPSTITSRCFRLPPAAPLLFVFLFLFRPPRCRWTMSATTRACASRLAQLGGCFTFAFRWTPTTSTCREVVTATKYGSESLWCSHLPLHQRQRPKVKIR